MRGLRGALRTVGASGALRGGSGARRFDQEPWDCSPVTLPNFSSTSQLGQGSSRHPYHDQIDNNFTPLSNHGKFFYANFLLGRIIRRFIILYKVCSHWIENSGNKTKSVDRIFTPTPGEGERGTPVSGQHCCWVTRVTGSTCFIR